MTLWPLWVVLGVLLGTLACCGCCCGCYVFRYYRSQPLGALSKWSMLTGRRYPRIERERWTLFRHEEGRRSRLLLVSFAGAALKVGGFPKREFQRSLRGYACDQLFLMDPSQSFFLDAPSDSDGGRWTGYRQLERRLRDEIAKYDGAMFIGCSMGASGALLFSHLARVVVAFNPLVDLDVERAWPRFPFWLRNRWIPAHTRRFFKQRIHDNIAANRQQGGRVFVHYSNFRPDVLHIDTLPTDAGTGCELVYHPGCDNHNTAKYLKKQQRLAPTIDQAVSLARTLSQPAAPAPGPSRTRAATAASSKS